MANRAETQAIHLESFDAIAEGFEAGQDEVELAAEYGVSPPTIGRWLMKAGYKHRGRGRYPMAVKERAADLRARGWDFEAIAKLLKVDRELVDEWVRGVPKNVPGRAKRNPGKGRVSEEAQELIDNPPWERHKRGRWWTEEQKLNVLDLMKRGFSPLEVFRIAGASVARQRSIWRETGSRREPPNIRARDKERRARKELEAEREERKKKSGKGPIRGPRKRVLAPGGRRPAVPEPEPRELHEPPVKRPLKPLPPEGRPPPYEPGDVPPFRPALTEAEEED